MKQYLLLLIVLLWIFAGAADGKPPNIIFVMADDLGYGDLGCYGQTLIKTPNIDRLAAQGIRCTQAYAGSTVCTPSRGILMTGLHNGHAPVRDNVPHYHTYLRDRDITLAEVLKQVGYCCGGIGKWSLGDPGTEGRPTNQGFDGWLGYLNQDHAHYFYPEYLDEGDERRELPGNSRSKEHYSHNLVAEWALRFIRESQAQPFFLYAAYTIPHYANSAEDRTQFPVVSDAPYGDQDWTGADKNYAAMITLLDTDVGRIVKLTGELKIDRRTLIIFTSDNGPWSGAPVDKFRSSGPLRGHTHRLIARLSSRPPCHRAASFSSHGQSSTVLTVDAHIPTSSKSLRIQAIFRYFALQQVDQIKRSPGMQFDTSAVGIPSIMAGCYNIRAVQYGIRIVTGRFIVVDIETGAVDDLIFQGRLQGPLINDITSRGVDQDRSLPHHVERILVDDVPGFICEIAVQGDHMAFG